MILLVYHAYHVSRLLALLHIYIYAQNMIIFSVSYILYAPTYVTRPFLVHPIKGSARTRPDPVNLREGKIYNNYIYHMVFAICYRHSTADFKLVTTSYMYRQLSLIWGDLSHIRITCYGLY